MPGDRLNFGQTAPVPITIDMRERVRNYGGLAVPKTTQANQPMLQLAPDAAVTTPTDQSARLLVRVEGFEPPRALPTRT